VKAALRVLAVLAVWHLIAGAALAQTCRRDEDDPGQQVAKQPPPPLFPRHRRGIYTANQIEFIDATPQSPPLEIDDPGVPQPGQWEVNFTTSADLGRSETEFDVLLVDANLGLMPRIFGCAIPTQLKIEAPYAALTQEGAAAAFGLASATVGLKFNFYDNEAKGKSASIYPQLKIAVPASARRGLTDYGQTIIVPLLFAKYLHNATLVINGSLAKPLHSEEGATTTLAIGLGRAFLRKVALMGEVHAESSVRFSELREVEVTMGAMYDLLHIPVYASVGRTLHAPEGGPRTSVLFGVKLQTH